MYIHDTYDIKFETNEIVCVMYQVIQEFCIQLEEEEDGKKLGATDLSHRLCPASRRRLEAGLCTRRLARPGLRSAAPGLPAAAALPSGTAELP